MIRKLIAWCADNPFIVTAAFALAIAGSIVSIRNLPLDAIPDLSETQVIVTTEWMGRSPDLIEDQVTYPIVSKLISAPRVKAVRGSSMYSMSFVYVIFEDGTDPYWARSRVLEYLSSLTARLPPGTRPVLGPDATSLGWVYQYALVDKSGKHDLAEIRATQDFNLRYALESVPGVAEVASVGGFQKQYQVSLDPKAMLAHGVTLQEVAAAVGKSTGEVGGRAIEMASKQVFVRGRGYVTSPGQIGAVVVKASGGVPLLVRDLGQVSVGGDLRLGAGDFNGEGETVGGIVIARYGENALDVIERVKTRIDEIKPSLPEGIEIVTTYDRSGLIQRAIGTLEHTLLQEGIVVSLVILIFLLHFRSSLIPIVALPIAVLISFIPMKLLGVTSNIMSLGGIAVAIGAMVDGSIVMVENAHKKLELAGEGSDRRRLVVEAAMEVGPAIFFSLLVITAAFIPVFALTGQAGKLFHPLAYTKTFAMGLAAVAAVTLVPVLMKVLIRGRVLSESRHPVSRVLIALYKPFIWVALKRPWTTVLIGLLAVLSAVPAASRLGSEFMPPLEEGDILYMPTTLPGVSIDEAARSLQLQDKMLASFPEVASVYGKVGRADTATDPAPLSMVETVVRLKPKDTWRMVPVKRFYSGRVPGPLEPLLSRLLPEERRITMQELVAGMDAAAGMPGWTDAWTMPIKTRIDMLATGIRTPVGIKILGPDLHVVENIGMEIEAALRGIDGVRSVYSERNLGGLYVDLTPDREKAARYGLNVADVENVIETAVGGSVVGITVDGRQRTTILVRYERDSRESIDALGDIVVAGKTGGGEAAGAMGAMGTGAWAAGGGTGAAPYVTLGQVADIAVSSGPPMIKDEDGMLAGYVYIDVDTDKRDIGGFVEEARRAVAAGVGLPKGFRLKWTGQIELMQQMHARLRIAVPLALAIIIFLLHLQFRSVAKIAIVMLSLPFSLVGSLWLMKLTGSNLSTATWVGIIAMLGLAAETGILMIVYLDLAYEHRRALGLMATVGDIREAVMEGAVQRLRPKLMTVLTTFIGLLPLLWAQGSGADVMRRLAIPLIGGLATSTFLTLEIIPVIYLGWRSLELRHAARTAAVTKELTSPARPGT